MAFRRGHWYIYGGVNSVFIGHGRHIDGPVTTDACRGQWESCENDPDEPKGVYVPYEVLEELIVDYSDRHPEAIAAARERVAEKQRRFEELEHQLDAGEIDEDGYDRACIELSDAYLTQLPA